MGEHEHEQDAPEEQDAPAAEAEANEAAEAEAEAEAETPHDEEPEPEPAPQDALTPEEVEKRFRAFAKARTSYIGKVEAIFEEMMAGMVYCPLCSDEVMGYVNEHAAGQLDPEIVKRTMRYLGHAPEVEYDQAPTLRECDTCSGLGQVKTGSRVVGREKTTCASCKGYGYLPPPQEGAQVAALVPRPTGEQAPSPDDFEQEDRDNWGEPRILPDGRPNPNFGKWPQYKVPVEPYGITAGLTVQNAAEGS